MPSRKVVFGRFAAGSVPTVAAGTNFENVRPSSVERPTYTVAWLPFFGNETNAMYRSPAASTEGWMYVFDGPVCEGAVTVTAFENVCPRSRDVAMKILV